MIEQKIIVIIPFYNVAEHILECYNSLIKQDYQNFELYFIDDASKDGSLDKIPDDDIRVIKKRNQQRVLALRNIYNAIVSGNFDEDDILIFVDGDDYLSNDKVFAKINSFYHEKKCLLSYGQYTTIDAYKGHCSAYTKAEFFNLRSLDWRASHLKTFKYKLYKEFLLQDPTLSAYMDSNNDFYAMTYDIAIMHPLLEIAGHENIFFNDEVLYIYRLHEYNDDKVNGELQRSIEHHIKSKPAFKQSFLKDNSLAAISL